MDRRATPGDDGLRKERHPRSGDLFHRNLHGADRQGENEGRASAGAFGFHPDASFVALDDTAAQGEADATAFIAPGAMQALEHLEQAAGLVGGDADAVIGEAEPLRPRHPDLVPRAVPDRPLRIGERQGTLAFSRLFPENTGPDGDQRFFGMEVHVAPAGP